MRLKIGLNLAKNYSINFDNNKRNKKNIKFIIIHYTGMNKESEAIKRLSEFNAKVSTHYFIKNNGNVINMVPDLYEAWHAGISCWHNYKFLNKNSIGIEINNPGHSHRYRPFFSKQILSLMILLKYLIKKYKIKPKNILGHSDIAPKRKKDPGEKFPWENLAKKKLSIWYDLRDKEIKKFRKIKLSSNQESVFFNNLHKIGYCKIENMRVSKNRVYLVKAFQRRFRQKLINGKIDKECLLISESLVKK